MRRSLLGCAIAVGLALAATAAAQNPPPQNPPQTPPAAAAQDQAKMLPRARIGPAERSPLRTVGFFQPALV